MIIIITTVTLKFRDDGRREIACLCLDKNTGGSATLKYTICLIKITKKRPYCFVRRTDIKERDLNWASKMGLKNGLLVQTLQETILMITKTGNAAILALQSQHQLIQDLNERKTPEMVQRRIKEHIRYRIYKLWRERNKTERLYIDANNLANARGDVMKKKRLTDAELREIKNEVKTIIKKAKEKVVATEQRESES